jgi:hypothetical protein
VAFVAGRGQRLEGAVDLGGARAGEREADSGAALRGRPAGVERPDRLDRVPGQPQAAREGDLDVRFGVGAGRDVQPEATVERELGRHVRDDQPDDIQ